jgi:hypothetical protein
LRELAFASKPEAEKHPQKDVVNVVRSCEIQGIIDAKR